MAKVSISEAARLSGISRQHLYRKYIAQGLLSIEETPTRQKVIDTSELLRVFGTLKSGDSSDNVTDYKSTQVVTPKSDSNLNALTIEVTLLREQLAATREQVNSLKDDKEWLKGQVDSLTETLKQIEHRKESEPVTEKKKMGLWQLLTTPIGKG